MIRAYRDGDMSTRCRCFRTLPCRCRAKLLMQQHLLAVAEGRQVTNPGYAQAAAVSACTRLENSRVERSRLPARCKKTSSRIASGDARYGASHLRIVTFCHAPVAHFRHYITDIASFILARIRGPAMRYSASGSRINAYSVARTRRRTLRGL